MECPGELGGDVRLLAVRDHAQRGHQIVVKLAQVPALSEGYKGFNLRLGHVHILQRFTDDRLAVDGWSVP